MISIRLVSKKVGARAKKQLMVSDDGRGWVNAKSCYSTAWNPIHAALEAVEDITHDSIHAYEVLCK